MKVRLPLLPGWLRWGTVVALTAFIFYVSIVTVTPETPIDPARPALIPLDKWRHLVAYATLGGALAYAMEESDARTLHRALVVVGATVLYGLGIEFGQSFRPQRYFSLGDAYANALGGVLSLSWYMVRPYIELVSPSALFDERATRGD